MVIRRPHRSVGMDRSATDLSVLIKHFEIHNRTEGKSPHTVTWYNLTLDLLRRWLVGENRPTDIGSIGEMDIREFILYYQNRPGIKSEKVSSHSVESKVRGLRAFFAWLAEKGYTEENELANLRPPRTSELVIEPLTEEEIDKVLTAINPNTLLGARNTSLISLILDSGLRRAEVAGLKEYDVHLEDRYVKVFGKGSKERLVSFGVNCQRALLHYYHHYRVQPVNPSIDTFFLAIDGFPLKPAGIKSMMRRLGKTSGVERLHPHLLRHTYATMFLLNGGDVFLLQQNLGHTSLEIVRRYIHVASRLAVVRSQNFSPLDRMNVKDSRRFRHSFDRSNGIAGRIYPNSGSRRKSKSRSRKRGQ